MNKAGVALNPKAATVLIVMAMRGEAQPIIDKLQLTGPTQPFQPLPILCYHGIFGATKLVILVNGVDPATQMDMIGTQSAAVTTALGLREFSPILLLNFGTCGALQSKGMQIGDLVLSCDRVWYHTRRIPLPGWDQYGVGGYVNAGTAELAAKLRMKSGVLSSTDSLDFPPLDEEIFHKVGADLADMEGAAIACLAEMHAVPFYSLKGVTDLMDLDLKVGTQFEKHFAMVNARLADGALLLLKELLEPLQ